MEKSEPVPDKAKGSEDKPADDVEDTSKEEEVPAEDDSKEDKEVPAPAKGKEDTEQAANEPPANNSTKESPAATAAASEDDEPTSPSSKDQAKPRSDKTEQSDEPADTSKTGDVGDDDAPTKATEDTGKDTKDDKAAAADEQTKEDKKTPDASAAPTAKAASDESDAGDDSATQKEPAATDSTSPADKQNDDADDTASPVADSTAPADVKDKQNDDADDTASPVDSSESPPKPATKNDDTAAKADAADTNTDAKSNTEDTSKEKGDDVTQDKQPSKDISDKKDNKTAAKNAAPAGKASGKPTKGKKKDAPKQAAGNSRQAKAASVMRRKTKKELEFTVDVGKPDFKRLSLAQLVRQQQECIQHIQDSHVRNAHSVATKLAEVVQDGNMSARQELREQIYEKELKLVAKLERIAKKARKAELLHAILIYKFLAIEKHSRPSEAELAKAKAEAKAKAREEKQQLKAQRKAVRRAKTQAKLKLKKQQEELARLHAREEQQKEEEKTAAAADTKIDAAGATVGDDSAHGSAGSTDLPQQDDAESSDSDAAMDAFNFQPSVQDTRASRAGVPIQNEPVRDMIDVMYEYKPALRRIFSHYANSHDYDGEMAVDDWFDFCQEYQLIPTYVSPDAVQTTYDHFNFDGGHLSFFEWMQALVRLAMAVSMQQPHPDDTTAATDDDDVAPMYSDKVMFVEQFFQQTLHLRAAQHGNPPPHLNYQMSARELDSTVEEVLNGTTSSSGAPRVQVDVAAPKRNSYLEAYRAQQQQPKQNTPHYASPPQKSRGRSRSRSRGGGSRDPSKSRSPRNEYHPPFVPGRFPPAGGADNGIPSERTLLSDINALDQELQRHTRPGPAAHHRGAVRAAAPGKTRGPPPANSSPKRRGGRGAGTRPSPTPPSDSKRVRAGGARRPVRVVKPANQKGSPSPQRRRGRPQDNRPTDTNRGGDRDRRRRQPNARAPVRGGKRDNSNQRSRDAPMAGGRRRYDPREDRKRAQQIDRAQRRQQEDRTQQTMNRLNRRQRERLQRARDVPEPAAGRRGGRGGRGSGDNRRGGGRRSRDPPRNTRGGRDQGDASRDRAWAGRGY